MKKEKVGRYMNLLVDFAFKRVFATEENKALLIAFLNEVVPHQENIIDVQYLPTEQLGNIEGDRKAIFDLYCIDEKKERYIIEMQIARQKHFMERSLFYATFPLQSQAVKGKWNFEMKPLYHIALLNFSLFEDNDCISHVSLMKEENREKVSDILNFIIIELPKFKKKIEELETKLDCWMFNFKNMDKLECQPPEIQGEIFDKLFSAADKNKLTAMELKTYNKDILQYADVRRIREYSLEEGEKRGIQQGMKQGAQQQAIFIAGVALKEGLSVEMVAKLTGLPVQEVKLLALSMQKKHNS